MSHFEIPEGYEMRMRIIKAITQEMKGGSLEHVPVSRICEMAGIARQTFYRYFTDKYDAVHWYDKLFKLDSLVQIGRTLTWHEGHLKMCTYVYEEQDFFAGSLTNNRNHESLYEFAIRFTESEHRKTLAEVNGIQISPLLDFQVGVWCRLAVEVTVAWVLDGFKFTPEEHAVHLTSLVPNELMHAMDDAVIARRAHKDEIRAST